MPQVLVSLVPVAILVALLAFCVFTFGTDTLSGASQLSLLASSGIAAAIGVWRYKLKWEYLERSFVDSVSEVMPSVLILLTIGALSGAWMVSGIVPGFIYYGIQIIHPKFFLATACIVCSIVSLMTGSSWTTIATIGLALIGIGRAQGFDIGVVAGAIISGSYFGDKMSPLSDTTILASSVTGTPLFRHIRYMTVTTAPAMAITLAVFVAMGLCHDVASTEYMTMIADSFSSKFNITPLVFIVPAITSILILAKTPSIVALFASTLLGMLFAVAFQCDVLREIAAGGGVVKGVVMAVYGKSVLEFPDKIMVELTKSGGMAGMLDTVWLIICAMVFGGIMKACRMLESITLLFVRLIRGRISMISSTIASGVFFNTTLADQYLAIILTGGMYKPVYEDKGYDSRLLSRTTEDAVTVTSPLIPWSTCGMTQATMLSVPTITYLPYSFFNILCPLMTIAVAVLGIGIRRTKTVAAAGVFIGIFCGVQGMAEMA